jgi:transposase
VLLQEIPGVDKTVAAAIIAEMGADMSVFAYSRVFSQLGSWEGVCPGDKELAGKRMNSRNPEGNVYRKTTLVKVVRARLGQKLPISKTSSTV